MPAFQQQVAQEVAAEEPTRMTMPSTLAKVPVASAMEEVIERGAPGRLYEKHHLRKEGLRGGVEQRWRLVVGQESGSYWFHSMRIPFPFD